MHIAAKEILDRHLLKISLILSVLIHLLILLLYKPISQWQLIPLEEMFSPEKQENIEKRIEFQLVETPADAESETPPENTNLLSDKNSRARDRADNLDLPVGAPFSKGDMDIKELPPQASYSPGISYAGDAVAAKDKNLEKTEKSDREVSDNSFLFQKFSRQQLLKNNQAEQFQMPQSQSANKPRYDNQKFRAEDLGGLTFNTYAWNFAPYMLAMKRKVEHNIFPPPAFTRMGLISGETLLRFKVMPDGEVKDIKVLQYKGHVSLKETSVQAILNSSPFKPLPADFPEDFLEVTARFSYYIQRR